MCIGSWHLFLRHSTHTIHTMVASIHAYCFGAAAESVIADPRRAYHAETRTHLSALGGVVTFTFSGWGGLGLLQRFERGLFCTLTVTAMTADMASKCDLRLLLEIQADENWCKAPRAGGLQRVSHRLTARQLILCTVIGLRYARKPAPRDSDVLQHVFSAISSFDGTTR